VHQRVESNRSPVPGLILSAQPFGFMALLGVIALVGVVVNNAIDLGTGGLDLADAARGSRALPRALPRRVAGGG
jgi:hypothetical protein